MERLTRRDRLALLDLVRGCYAPRDRDAFFAHLLRALPTLIASDLTGYAEVRFPGQMIRSAHEPAEVGFPGADQSFERLVGTHPCTIHYLATRDGRALAISDFLTRRQFHDTALYQEFFRRIRIEDHLVVFLDLPPPLHLGVSLNRSRRDFTARDRLLLTLLRPHLNQAYHTAAAITRMQHEGAVLRQAVEDGGRGMVGLTRDGRVEWMTPQARQWVGVYFGRTLLESEPLPDPLQRWVRHEEAQLNHVDDAPLPRTPLVVERDGARLVVRHLCDGEVCTLLLQEQPTARDASLPALPGLTAREHEVLSWVAHGKTNVEIGLILSLSDRTVDKHLERIFEKLGVESRTAAAVLWSRAQA